MLLHVLAAKGHHLRVSDRSVRSGRRKVALWLAWVGAGNRRGLRAVGQVKNRRTEPWLDRWKRCKPSKMKKKKTSTISLLRLSRLPPGPVARATQRNCSRTAHVRHVRENHLTIAVASVCADQFYLLLTLESRAARLLHDRYLLREMMVLGGPLQVLAPFCSSLLIVLLNPLLYFTIFSCASG